MALILDATVGGSNANTYLILSEADAYFEARLNDANWTGKSDTEKNEALAHATARLDHEEFDGVRAKIGVQRLKWPRSGMVDDDDVSISTAVIPRQIKDATCELALVLLGSDIQEHSDLRKFREMKVGDITLTPAEVIENELPQEVLRLIAPFQTTVSGGLIRG